MRRQGSFKSFWWWDLFHFLQSGIVDSGVTSGKGSNPFHNGVYIYIYVCVCVERVCVYIYPLYIDIVLYNVQYSVCIYT